MYAIRSYYAKESDLITCYRMAPHEDALESKQRALENLLDRLESGLGKPKYKAWIPVPILLPGEKTSTRIVITSYSIHYTKLYDSVALALVGGWISDRIKLVYLLYIIV